MVPPQKNYLPSHHFYGYLQCFVSIFWNGFKIDKFGEFWVLVFPLMGTIYIYTYVNTHTEGSKQNVHFDSSLYLGHSAV